MKAITTQFQVGEHVKHVPSHTYGDCAHPDCQNGVIRSFSTNGLIAYVDYGKTVRSTPVENLVAVFDLGL